MSKIGVIVQARTESTRLKNKVIKPFYNEKTILDILLSNLQTLGSRYKLILATTKNDSDNILCEFAKKHHFECYKGEENNVLKRFINAADYYNVTTIVRVCSDNPFLQVQYIENLMDIFNKKENLDYCSYKVSDGTPVVRTHLGLFAEVVSIQSLKKAMNNIHDSFYLEHVTNFIYSSPKYFNVHLEPSPDFIYNRNDLRFTVDDLNDFNNLSEVYKYYLELDSDIQKTITYLDKKNMFKTEMINNINKYNK